MNRNRTIGNFALALACLTTFNTLHAENIRYDGTNPPLQTAPDPGNTANSLFPGTASSPSPSNNTVTIDYSAGNDPTRVFGGVSSTESAQNNTVVLLNGTITNRIYGGYSMSNGNHSVGNTVRMSGGAVSGSVYGAHSIDGNSTDNKVIINGGNIGVSVYGGSANTGNTIGNSVEISGTAEIVSNVLGGLSASGEASGNTVTISNGWIKGGVWGGESDGSQAASNNTVIINGGLIGDGDPPFEGLVFGGANYGTGDAFGNRIVMNSGTVTYDLVGGRSNTGSVNGNFVEVHGGTVTRSVTGGQTIAGDEANNNTVTIKGGSVGHIDGGQNLGNGDASGNQVFVQGGVINGSITGGATNDNTGTGSTINNRVVLSEAVVFSSPTILRGGLGGGTGDYRSGNTLELRGFQGDMLYLENFENYGFILPNDFQSGDVMIHSINQVTELGINANVYRLDVAAGQSALASGTEVILIQNVDTAPTASTLFNTQIRGQQGVSLLYDFDLFLDDSNTKGTDSLYAKVRKIQVNPGAKVLSEGRAASLAFLNQGQDFLVNKGFDAAWQNLRCQRRGWSRATGFGAVGGGHFRHKTGSHVDVDGVSFMTGLARYSNCHHRSLMFGVFFEGGYADYETHNAFATGAIRGDGDSRYFGGGFLTRYAWQNGWYAEASGRVGNVRNKFDSDLTDPLGNRARYNINSAYLGAHVGIGYKQWIGSRLSYDFSTKYLWSWQDDDSANIAGDPVRFQADDSHRWRTGARFSYAVNHCFVPYLGAAFEYEFDGDARAGAYGYNYGVPSLKGGTGIGELGLTCRSGHFVTDAGIQGHCGRRDGVSGNITIGWQF